MRDIYLCILLFIHFTSKLCHGSINTHSGKFGYQSAERGISDLAICSVKSPCEPILFNMTCFGTALPYASTSVALANDSTTQFDVHDNLAMFEGLRSIPRCWSVVQPLLCAIYMPKCENGSVSLPTQKMCRITREPCKFVETIKGWPSFLRCDNKKLFPSHCRNPLEEIKFNTTSKCIAPLTETDNEENYFHEVENCGLQCQDPFFTKKEHDNFHFIACIGGFLGLFLSLVVMFTYIISWKRANCYPGIIVFYINICLISVDIGYLIQFFGVREQIVCNPDGTVRRQHPRFEGHLCTITFLLTYPFLLAAMIWFGILSYAMYITLSESSGCTKDTLKKRHAYFHIGAWCFPLFISVLIMAMKEVEGDSMSGICFVGNSELINMARWVFLFTPIVLAAAVSFFMLCYVLNSLRKLKTKTADMRVKKLVGMMMWKLTFFYIAGLFIFISISVSLAYDSINRNDWNFSLRDYIVCLAKTSAQPYLNMEELPVTKCVLKSKPSVGPYYLQLFCLLFFHLIMSFWILTSTTKEAWQDFFFSCCEPSERKSKTLKKHAIIAKAFQHRNEINQGHYSFSLNSHDDPAGLNLDLDSIASRDISSSWAKALPKFIMRRNAQPFIAPSFPSRHYSSASDISRQMSIDSYNQQNLDSLSMQISEQEYAKHTRRRTRKERERFLRANRIAPWFPGNRRGSDTSLQSSLMTASIVAAAKSLGAKVTKSTSTGDLGIQAALQAAAFGTPMVAMGSTIASTPIIPAQNRNFVQREKVNPPFMHGMDGSCGLDAGLNPRVICRNVRPFNGSTVGQRFTPYPTGAVQNSMGGVVRPPMFRPQYDMMNIPFGYIGGGMYPINGMYPGYSAADFNYAAYSAAPYLAFGAQSAEAFYQYQSSLIPLQPRVDSASETEYLPIIMSDSEYTDSGLRSYDEAQLLSACLMQQERLKAQAMAAAAASSELTPQAAKPTLEPQADAKTQLLKRMFDTSAKPSAAPVSRPASGKRTPHSEAPPPSPADSLASLEMGNDDVFEEAAPTQEVEEVLETELSPLMEDKKGSSPSLNRRS